MKDQGRIEPAEILQVKTKGVKDHEKQNDYKAGTKQIDILQTKTEDGVEFETESKQAAILQAKTEITKNYLAGDRPDILQAKTKDVVEEETETKQFVILQDETASAKNYEAGDKQNTLHKAKTVGAEYQAKTTDGVKNY